MKDLTDPFWIKLKGFLFLLLGVLSVALLVAQHQDFRTLLLLVIAIWGFCRAYYFALYVIEKYVDSRFRFSGLGSFALWLCSKPKGSESPTKVRSGETTDDSPPS